MANSNQDRLQAAFDRADAALLSNDLEALRWAQAGLYGVLDLLARGDDELAVKATCRLLTERMDAIRSSK